MTSAPTDGRDEQRGGDHPLQEATSSFLGSVIWAFFQYTVSKEEYRKRDRISLTVRLFASCRQTPSPRNEILASPPVFGFVYKESIFL
jgi:hypothetical protein